MRIINLFIVLIFFITSYAHSINILRRDVTLSDEETFWNSISEECRKEYENSEYMKCNPTINIINYKDACTDIKSESCQNFYNDPLKYYPICKDIPKFSELFHPNLIKSLLQTYSILCQTDENGDLCPFSLSLMTNSDNNDVLNDQCKSKICT